MEPLKEQRWRPTGQSGSKLRALQTRARGSVAPSNIEGSDMDRDVMMREAFGTGNQESLVVRCDSHFNRFSDATNMQLPDKAVAEISLVRRTDKPKTGGAAS
jgi:hypothetical protein